MSSNEQCWQGYSLLSPSRIVRLGKNSHKTAGEGRGQGRREKCFNKVATKTTPTCRILLKYPLIIFINKLTGRPWVTNQIMHGVELGIPRTTQIKQALIFPTNMHPKNLSCSIPSRDIRRARNLDSDLQRYSIQCQRSCDKFCNNSIK
jgi:hypothetical protein